MPKNVASVGATSTVCACRGDETPFLTSRWPPPMKNGIRLVAGWPWLPGIGLPISGLGSLNRQPCAQ